MLQEKSQSVTKEALAEIFSYSDLPLANVSLIQSLYNTYTGSNTNWMSHTVSSSTKIRKLPNTGSFLTAFSAIIARENTD